MENNNLKKENSFPLLRTLRSNLFLIFMLTVLITLSSVLLGILYVKPVYTVSRSVILRTELIADTNEAANGSLAGIYMPQMEQHFTSSKFIQMANEKYALINKDWQEDPIKANDIEIKYNKGSYIFTIGYKGTDKKIVVEKLNAICVAAGIGDTKVEEQGYFAQISAACTIKLISTDNSIYDLNKLSVDINNRLTQFIVLGLLAGFIIAVIIAVIKQSLDNTINNKQELEELIGVSMLAQIRKI